MKFLGMIAALLLSVNAKADLKPGQNPPGQRYNVTSSTASIPDGSITNAKIANGTIDTAKFSSSVDARYVNVPGDTMTGALIINNPTPTLVSPYSATSLPPAGQLISNEQNTVFRTSSVPNGFTTIFGPNMNGVGYGGIGMAISGVCATGNEATPGACASGNSMLFLGGKAYDSAGSKVLVDLQASESQTPTAAGTRIRFSTTKIGGTTRRVRAQINDFGQVIINPRADTITSLGALDVGGVNAGDSIAGNGVSIYAREAITAVTSVTANAFFGNGSALTGISVGVPTTGGTMTGRLTAPEVYISSNIAGTGEVLRLSGSGSSELGVYTDSVGGGSAKINVGRHVGATHTVLGSVQADATAGNPIKLVSAGAVNAAVIVRDDGLVSMTNNSGFAEKAITVNGDSYCIGCKTPTTGYRVTLASATNTTDILNVGGALSIVSGSSLTLSGSDGFITTQSSINASAFFGDGQNLTNMATAVSSSAVASQTVASTSYIFLATATITTGGMGHPLNLFSIGTFTNGSGSSRSYTCAMFRDGVQINGSFTQEASGTSDVTLTLIGDDDGVAAGSHTYSLACKSSSASGAQTVANAKIRALDF